MTAAATPGRRAGGNQIIPRPSRWSPGPDAPWSTGATASLADVRSAVPRREAPLRPASADARDSAVLVTLIEGDDGPEVLLTRRSWDLRNHRGEVSFPGGRVDPGESTTDAALREAHEEVGLDPTLVTVIGELDHLDTAVSRSYIVPKVATLDGRPGLVPQTMEVDRVWWVPLAEFTRPDTYRSEIWTLGRTERTLHFFELGDETVWGATAHMLVDLFRRVLV